VRSGGDSISTRLCVAMLMWIGVPSVLMKRHTDPNRDGMFWRMAMHSRRLRRCRMIIRSRIINMCWFCFYIRAPFLIVFFTYLQVYRFYIYSCIVFTCVQVYSSYKLFLHICKFAYQEWTKARHPSYTQTVRRDAVTVRDAFTQTVRRHFSRFVYSHEKSNWHLTYITWIQFWALALNVSSYQLADGHGYHRAFSDHELSETDEDRLSIEWYCYKYIGIL